MVLARSFPDGRIRRRGPSACDSASCTGLYVAVRRIGGTDGPAHVHIADSVPAEGIMRDRFRRSETIGRCRQERSVKPSAQPTLVRTQHLPLPAKTAPGLRKRGPAGRFLLVTPCIRVCHRGSMRSSGYGHIADSVRAERAVRITARFADPRPFCPLSDAGTARLTDAPDIPARPVRFFTVLLTLGGGLALFMPAAGAGCRIGPHRPIEAATEALAECPSLPLRWKDRHSRAAGAAATRRKGSRCPRSEAGSGRAGHTCRARRSELHLPAVTCAGDMPGSPGREVRLCRCERGARPTGADPA